MDRSDEINLLNGLLAFASHPTAEEAEATAARAQAERDLFNVFPNVSAGDAGCAADHQQGEDAVQPQCFSFWF